MIRRIGVLVLLLYASMTAAHASGPVAPRGWNGFHEPVLPNGESCCLPADLNGTGLVGGAFVLISDNKKEFAIFALTYAPPLKERWHLLEKHPMAELAGYRVSLEAPGRYRFHSVKVCGPKTACGFYHFEPGKGAFKKVGQ